MTEAPVDMPEVVRSIVNAHKTDRGALLPILHEIQRQFGYIDAECVPVVAAELNLSRADVHGVMTFYRDFRQEPGGSTTVRMCRAEACQAVGAERLVAHAEQVFGIKVGQTTPDGSVTLGQTFCLGNCAVMSWYGWCRTRTAAPTKATRASRAGSPSATPPIPTG